MFWFIAFFVSLALLTWFIYYATGPHYKLDIKPLGKAIVTTGAASGMGQATALLFIKKGCIVYAFDINENALRTTFEKYGDQVVCVKVDVTKDEDVARAKEIVTKDLERRKIGLFGIVNCAGILYRDVNASGLLCCSLI
jgi:NAD(P)-dependent dehydrogenase (short-subunit alcohol dehydrogenase family)